jgi:hypothetical protein
MDATFYKKRYPDMKVIAPAAARARVEQVIAVDATEEDALPPLGITVHKIAGMKPFMSENALAVQVDGGKALILNDVIGGDGFAGPGSNFLLRMLGPPGGTIGIARVVRWMEIADGRAVKAALGRLAEIPDLKILTVSHGAPLRGDVGRAIRTAAAQL